MKSNVRNIKKASRPRDLNPDLGDEVCIGRVKTRKLAHRRSQERGVEQVYFNHTDLEFTKMVQEVLGNVEVFIVMDQPEPEQVTLGPGWTDLGWVDDHDGKLYEREAVFSWGDPEPISFTLTETSLPVLMLAVGLDVGDAIEGFDQPGSWIDGDIVTRGGHPVGGTITTWFRHDGKWLQAGTNLKHHIDDEQVDWLLDDGRAGTYRAVKRSGTLQ